MLAFTDKGQGLQNSLQDETRSSQPAAWSERISQMIAQDEALWNRPTVPPPFDLMATLREHRTAVFIVAGALAVFAVLKTTRR